MNETWRRIVPVASSIAIIVLIALLRERSKALAAITATMPVTIALGLWVVYVAEGGDVDAVVSFVQSMLVGIAATATWLLAVWLAARAGWGLPRLLLVGYLTWGIVVGAIFAVQSLTGSASILPH